MSSLQLTVDPVVHASLALLNDLDRSELPRDFDVRCWDGTTQEADPAQPARFTLVLQHPGALRAMFFPPNDLSVAEAYVYGDIDVEGDMTAFIGWMRGLAARRRGLRERLGLALRFLQLPKTRNPRVGRRQPVQLSGRRRSRERDRAAVCYHYDVSNEFYGLFLDPEMLYTCAYFLTPDEDLASAQERKMHYWCRKLRLQPGERLLDLGCGWGGFLKFAAQHYGVHGVGITLSKFQAEWAENAILQAGLKDRCQIIHGDYRDLDETRPFDKIMVLEVIEHLGNESLPVFFQKVWRLLNPGGLLGNQEITRNGGPIARQLRRWRRFNQQYVFPDGELRPPSVTLLEAEKAGFEIRNVECFREHYVLTLKHWLHNLEASHDDAVRFTDETTYRVWRLYLGAALFGQARGNFGLHHSLMVKPDARGGNTLPLSPRPEWDF